VCQISWTPIGNEFNIGLIKMSENKKKIITKSKYMIGLKCVKYIWIVYNTPEAIPKPIEFTEYLLEYGHRIEELAKRLYPNGIDMPTDSFMGNINKTKDMLKLKRPLFEPGFLIDNIYSRIDILNPVNVDTWDLIEVKQSTKVKDEHIPDVAFQKYCLKKAGIDIGKCFLAHVNKEYIKHGDIDPNSFFIVENIDDLLSDGFDMVSKNVDEISHIINSKKCPEVEIGAHCKKYYTCPLIKKCWGFLPKYNVLDLYRGGKKSFLLLQEGKMDIKDVPNNRLTDRQKIQRNCVISKTSYINKANIKRFIDDLQYPLYFMDFETIFEGIPLYDNTSPFQQIIFQFSIHLLEHDKAKLKHFEFLAEGQGDPRQQFLKELKNVLGVSGSILVYNEVFEITRLKELAETFPEYKDWIDTIRDRMVDLLKPFRAFDYYNLNQHGSCSLKKVLPAITGKGYDDLVIQEGGIAGQNWILATFDSNRLIEKRIKEIRTNLKLYCSRDTESMVWILNKLKELIS